MQGVAGGWSYERVSDFVFHLWKMLMMMFSSGVGFPSWFSLLHPGMDVNLLSSTMLSVFGLSQSLSDSICFSLLLLTLIRAIEYD